MNLLFLLLAPLSLLTLLRSSVPSEAFSPSLHLPQAKNHILKLGYRVHSPLDNTANDIEVSANPTLPRHLPKLATMSLGYFIPLALPAALLGSGVLNDDTMTFFATLGVAASLLTSISLCKLLVALTYESNFASAILPTPPREAFANKVVLITGASSGVGRALALHLSSKHDNVKLILASRRQDTLEEVAAECMNRGAGDVKVLTMDLSDHASLPSKAKSALSMYECGRVDILVNNGGVSTRSMARNSSFDVDTFVTDVDFLSYVALTKALLPSWEQQKISQGKGKPIIINTSSVAGKIGVPVRTAYAGSKHAIMGWFNAFRIEQILAGFPIQVLNIVLGSTNTDVAKNAVAESMDAKCKTVDSNIEQGLEVDFVVERVVAAAYAGQDEVWLAKKKELLLLYLNQYVPQVANRLFMKSMAKQYAVQNEN